MPEATATENVLTVEGLDKLFATQKSEVEKAVQATLHDWGEKFQASYRVDKGPEKPAAVEDKTEPKAELEEFGLASTFNKVNSFEFMDVPIGQAALGGFGAIFATELIDGWLASQSAMVRGVVKLGGAFVVVKFGSKWLGKPFSQTVALFMVFDGLKNDIMPGVFNYATTLANKLTHTTTTAGLGHTGGNVVIQRAASSGPVTTKSAYASSGLIH